MKTCFAKYGYEKRGPKVKSDFTINNIEELQDIISS